MEIQIIRPAAVKIKGKGISFVVDPQEAGKAKIAADAVLLLSQRTATIPDIEGCRLVMSGPGEYELGGVKITGTPGHSSYFLTLDGISLMVGSTSGLSGKENLRDVAIAVLFADSIVDQSILATVASNVAIFYGPQAEANVKAAGKTPAVGEKYVITKDKLPQEMEVVVLQ